MSEKVKVKAKRGFVGEDGKVVSTGETAEVSAKLAENLAARGVIETGDEKKKPGRPAKDADQE